jgi:4-amino-4-deoxy-L-arabinose transferase-like glycosyltransferase
MLVIYPLSLATENVFFVLALSSVVALLKAKESLTARPPAGARLLPWRAAALAQRGRWFILAGLLLGLAALTRSVFLAFSLLAVLWIWFALRQRGLALLTLAAAMLTAVPWMVRNTRLHGRLVGIESALGYDLYLGYHPEGTGTFQYPQSLDLMTMLDDGERDEIGRSLAWGFIRDDPGRVPYLVLRRAGHFFGLERRAMTYFYANDFFGYVPTPLLLALAAILCLPYAVLSVSAAAGLAILPWRKDTILLALFLIGYIGPHLLILGEDRFHLSTVPFTAVLAAFFWSGGWTALRRRWETRAGRIGLCLALLAMLLLFLNWGLELWRDMDTIRLLLGPTGNRLFLPY